MVPWQGLSLGPNLPAVGDGLLAQVEVAPQIEEALDIVVAHPLEHSCRKETSVDVDAMARAVIRGDYGNGDERKRRLGSYYSIVQARVNEMLS